MGDIKIVVRTQDKCQVCSEKFKVATAIRKYMLKKYNIATQIFVKRGMEKFSVEFGDLKINKFCSYWEIIKQMENQIHRVEAKVNVTPSNELPQYAKADVCAENEDKVISDNIIGDKNEKGKEEK